MLRSTFCFFAMLCLASCSAPRTTPLVTPSDNLAFIEIRNDHWRAIRVFMVAAEGRYFLGDIAPDAVQLFQIPKEFIKADGKAQFLADPDGSADEYLTEPIQVAGVGRIYWRLRKSLYNSRPIRL